MFYDNELGFNVEFFSKTLASWLNETLQVPQAPDGSSCRNCFWRDIDNYKMTTCKAPLHYIGMQVEDCIQYRKKN